MDSRSNEEIFMALFAIAGMVKGRTNELLKQAVRECFVLKDYLSGDLLGILKAEILKGSNKAASDLLCLLEVLNLVKDESHMEAKQRAIRAVQGWNCDCLTYNPLQLAVYDLMCEAILKSTVEVEGKTTVFGSLADKSGQVVAFPQSNRAVLLHKCAMINVIKVCINNPNIDTAELLDIGLFGVAGVKRLEDEMRQGISITIALELIRVEYEGLPPAKVPPPVLTYYPGSSESSSEEEEEESSNLDQLHIVKKGKKSFSTLDLFKKMDNMDLKLDGMRKSMDLKLDGMRKSMDLKMDAMGKKIDMLHADMSVIAESTGRSLLLQTLRSQFPEVTITCYTSAREFDYDSSTPAATALEALGKRCLKSVTREIPQTAEIDCVCKMTIPSFGTDTPTYYYFGEITRSNGLCSCASEYRHSSSTGGFSPSTTFLYKLVQLERGILAADAQVLGCAVISPSFRGMSEDGKSALLSVCLGQSPELRNLNRMYEKGHVLLLPS